MDLTIKNVNELFTQDDINAFVAMKQYEEMWNQIKASKEEQLKAYMKSQGIKKIDTDELRITFIEATTRTSVDTKKLKEDGLYDYYSKESAVKESVRIELK